MNDASLHIAETTETIADLERAAHAGVSAHQRGIERTLRLIGRPRSVYAIVGFVLLWTGANLALGRRAFDPVPFFGLQGLVSLSALLMTVLILTTENRTAQTSLRREQLDLQINLLTERKVAKLIQMVDELRRDLPDVPTGHDPEVRQLRERTDPQAVAQAIEERTPSDGGG